VVTWNSAGVIAGCDEAARMVELLECSFFKATTTLKGDVRVRARSAVLRGSLVAGESPSGVRF
jgi:hypothetical protein